MAEYAGGYPVADVGPNDGSASNPPDHFACINAKIENAGDGASYAWRQYNDPNGAYLPRWINFAATATVERYRLVSKPSDVDVLTEVRIGVLSMTSGFDAGAALSFDLTLYKADGITSLGTQALVVRRNNAAGPMTPLIVHPLGDVDEAVFSGLTLTNAEVAAGLVIKIDSTSTEWAAGPLPNWDILAVDYQATFTPDTVVNSIVEGTSLIRGEAIGSSPLGACTGDSPIEGEVVGSSVFEQDT